MASLKALLIAAATMAVVVGALLPATSLAENHVVGDLLGWNLDTDFTEWIKYNDGVKVDDTLEFVYTQGDHTVVMVDEDSYNACNVPNNAQTWDTGDDMVQLPYAGKFFFICGVLDHCARGMKLAITAI